MVVLEIIGFALLVIAFMALAYLMVSGWPTFRR